MSAARIMYAILALFWVIIGAWGLWYGTRRPDRLDERLSDYRESGGP